MNEDSAILFSGGLDSAILLGESLRRQVTIHPIYVQFGMFWEAVELEYLHRFLDDLACPILRPLVVLRMPARPLYGEHWSLSGVGVPDLDSADDAVYLPGRNVLLLSQAMIWCNLNDVAKISLGSLQTNPFADATPEFFRLLEQVVNQGINGDVRLLIPYADAKKVEVMRRGRDLPLQHTFSCMRPRGKFHCGRCNKCAERIRAFADSDIADPTTYAATASD